MLGYVKKQTVQLKGWDNSGKGVLIKGKGEVGLSGRQQLPSGAAALPQHAVLC